MSRLQRQSGFVLPEILVTMILATMLLGATLVTFQNFVRNEGANDKRNDTIEAARNALDIEAKQLRNLAKRIGPGVIDTMQPDQFIFQTSDPTRTWVRYCLDTTNPSNGQVWEQTQSLGVTATGTPVTAGMRTGCPSSSGWTLRRQVAQNVVNRVSGANRPMFTYRCAGGGSACTSSTTTYDQVIGVTATLYIDTTPLKGPREERVTSGVYLRNQNQAPTAEFSATAITGKTRTVLLNASGSTDYEQRTLSYYWFVGTMPSTSVIDCTKPPGSQAQGQPEPWGVAAAGTGLTLEYQWPGTTPASGSAQTVGVVACDPGDRSSGLVTQTVTIPA
jgi:type II secretory pathway pseudopilin PulG